MQKSKKLVVYLQQDRDSVVACLTLCLQIWLHELDIPVGIFVPEEVIDPVGRDVEPELFERSLQAQFLKPMAISIGFGVLFATFITLFLVPVLYSVLNDLMVLFGQQKREVMNKTATAE